MAPNRRSVLVLTLAIVAAPMLAGCIGGGQGPSDAVPEPDNATGDGVAGDAAAPGEVDLSSVSAPTWEMLDWFRFDASGEWTTNTEYDVIVHMAGGDRYVTATDTREQAIYDLFWDDPFIGELDTELNPASPEMPEKVFDWPLTPNKEWTSQDGNGTTWEMIAHRRDSVETHAGTFGGYHIRGESETGWTIFVTYVPGLEWFSNWMLHRPDDEMMINVNMIDMGGNYSEEMFIGESTTHLEQGWSQTPDAPHGQTFTVTEDADHLRAHASMGSAGAYSFTLIDPEGEVHAAENGAADGVSTIIDVSDPIAGDWVLLAETTGIQDTPAAGGGYVRVVEMALETMSH